ncbi:hypothetical protein GGR53DRAFT_494815 [Hypoxylon sp. FL1150]|nr:hypothetical protein GGR53DRAFT_494815 [Hypoxylon sp. FL1150]
MAGNGNYTTLRSQLTQPKLPIVCHNINPGNSLSLQWPIIESSTITIWRDFNLPTLNATYAHLLDRRRPANILSCRQASTSFSTTDIRQPQESTLKVAYDVFPHIHGYLIAQDCTDVDTTVSRANIEGFKADHIIALDKVPLHTLVVGLAKASRKFSMRDAVGSRGHLATTSSNHVRVLR